MIKSAHHKQDDDAGGATPPPADEYIAPVPRISVQAFCETVETAAATSQEGQTSFLVTAPGPQPITASVTRTAGESKAPLYFSVALDREQTEL